MRIYSLLSLLIALAVFQLPADVASAHEICFPEKPEVAACFRDPFSDYWEANGGLPVFGYPLGNAQNERNPDLNVDLLTQWTERNRLEVHPQNQPPFNILLGRMGAERLAQIGRPLSQEGRENGPLPGCLWFQETGHNVCDQAQGVGFKSYWQGHGLNVPGLDAYGRSLQLFGLPLTVPRMETNANGDLVLTQWFERARFEWHPYQRDEFKVLLGLLGNELRAGAPLAQPPSVFGVEINRGNAARVTSKAADTGTSWVRFSGMTWDTIEATQGTRDWSKIKRWEDGVKGLSAAGMQPMALVFGTPAWAQKVPGSTCGAIKPDALDDFAAFVREAVTRYSKAPYNVKYWEIWNEPDVDPTLVPGDSGFGCWGDRNDPYYGGGYFADMLKQVYPAVKAADPTAQVMIGGLLLDCDPTDPAVTKDCSPARFYEGILRNGGANAFDILTYHAYNYWSPNAADWDLSVASWKARGGALLGKLSFLRETQARYGVQKPILMNEGGLLCYPGGACPNDAYFGAQANYVVRLYARTWAHGLLASSWYTLDGPGWREGGLLDRQQNARPGYNAYKFMSGVLDGAVYAADVSSGAVEGYAFQRRGARVHVYWTNSGATGTVQLPAGSYTVYNKLGERQNVSGSALQVGFEPVIVEIK
jgi:hypothetical protein